MNKIFKVIWNQVTQTWIAVSELTKSHGKSSRQTDKRQSPRAMLIGITATGALLFTLPALANTPTPTTGGGAGAPCKLSANNKDLACGNDTTKAGGTSITNSGKGNIAIGVGSVAQSVNNKTAGAGNIAIGHNVSALGSASTAIGISTGNYGGSQTIAGGSNSYAIGNGASTGGTGTAAIDNGGRKKYELAPDAAARAGEVNALGGIAIGSEAWIMNPATYGVAIGDNATAGGEHAMAYGRLTYASGARSIAMGTSTRASGTNAVSIGAYTNASGVQSIAIGGSSSDRYAAKASGASSISIGEETNSSGAQSVSLGKKANTSGAQAIALGFESNATSNQSIAVGKGAKASANQTIAIGDSSNASHEQSIALGKSAQAKANNAIAAGHSTQVHSANAVALGNNINIASGYENAVVLGANSTTQEGKQISTTTVNSITYSHFAGHENVNKGQVVSVGNSTHRRQIVNLAPGNVSATSTDAINGSQLYQVADTVANLAKATAAHLGGGSKLENNNITAPSYDLYTGNTTPATSGNSNTRISNAPFNNVGAALSGLNSYINQGFNIKDNAGTTQGVVTPGDSIKFANGKNTTSNITIEAGGVTTIAFDVANTALTVANGKVSTPNNNDGAKFVNATTVANAINSAYWKVGKLTNTNGITFNHAEDEVTAGDEVRFADGNFTTVKMGKKEENSKTTTAIKVDVDAQKVVESAQTPVVYTNAEGKKLVKSKNGKFYLDSVALGENGEPTNPANKEVNPADVIASINSGDNNSTKPTTLANIKSNLTEDNNGAKAPDFNTVAPNKNHAATLGDVLNAGWNLQENGTEKDFVKHGDTVNFKNGRGVQVNITKTTSGVNDVKFDTPLAYMNGNTESATPTNTVKFFGANNGGPVTLTNVNSGLGNQDLATAATSNPNNAVNVKDLHHAISGYSFTLGGEKTEGEFEALTGNNNDDKQIKKDETFKLQAGKNIKIKQIANGYEIATKDQLELGKNDPNGPDGSLNVTGKNGAGVNINGADGSLTLTGAPNNGQSPSLKITTEKGSPVINNTPADGINRIVYTDNGNKRQVATMDDGLTFAGDTGTASPRKLGETLTIKGGQTDSNQLSNGNNIGVHSDGNGNLTVKLAKNLTLGDNNANTGSIGGLTHNLPVPVPAQNTKQEEPANIADKQHKAATVGDVLNAGFNVRGAKTAGGQVEDVDFVKPYDTVEFVDGNATDLIVTNTDSKKTTVTVDIKTDGQTIQVDNTTKQLKAVTSDITDTPKQDGGKTFSPNTPTALVTAKTVADVANKLIEEGLNFAGNTVNTDIKRPLGTKLTIKGEKADENDVSAKNIYVKANATNNELLINFSEKPEFKEIKLADTGKSHITLNTTGTTDKPELTFKGDGDKAVALKNVGAGTTTLNGTNRGDKASNQNPTTIDTSTPLGNKLSTAYNGLADLHNSDEKNAFTVADARNLGWVVSVENNNYADAVRNAHEVRFVGSGLATVHGETTTDGVRKITVDVNAQKVVEAAQIPVVYTNSDGQKLIKSKNGKFYVEGTDLDENGSPTNPNNQAVEPENVIASMNSGSNATKNSPTTLANVKSNLMSSDNQVSAPTFNQLFKNNAATVEDVLNSGWNLKNNNTAKDFVVHDDNVDFVDGNATTFVVTPDETKKTNTIKVDINTDNSTIKVGDNKQLTAVTSEITSQDTDGKPTFTPTTGSSLVTAETVSNVANQIVGKGLDFTGNNDGVTVHRDLGTKLTIKGEKENDTDVSGKNIYVTADDNSKALVIKFSEKPEFKELKLAENGKSPITLNTTGGNDAPALTFNTPNSKAVALKNVSAGTTTLDGTNRGDKATGQTPTTIDATTPMGKALKDAYSGLANLQDASDTNAFTVADAKNLGWVVSAKNNDYADDVRHANEVRFIGTNMATVTGETKDGVREITVDVNAQKVVEAAQIPVVYTDKAGKKLIKSPNGKFYAEGTALGPDGEPENPADQPVANENVITSLNNAEGNTTQPTTLANVKSNLTDGNDKTSTPEFVSLNTSNAATVGDVLNSGWDLLENGTAKDFVKHGDKVNFINGRGTKVTIGKETDGTNTIKLDTPLAYVNTNTTDQSTPSNEVKLVGADENNPVKLGNIASVIGQQSLSDAATANPNHAVNVSDLNKAIGDFNFKLGGEAAGGEFVEATNKDCDDSCIKKDETFKLNAGNNIKIKQITNGYEIATKDQITLGSKTQNDQEGVDGNLTVTGKDGASVAIDGKDASITLTGKTDNGHTPTVKIGTEKGNKTIDPADTNGIDRIVYTTTENGQPKKRQVATLDDGLVFAGDSGDDSKRKLGEKLTIKGGESDDSKLSSNPNIGVISNGNGELTIKLAKNLNLGDPNEANNGKISGLAHNLPVPAQKNKQDGPPTDLNQHNAATVGDVLNAGWNLKNNGSDKDFVKPYDTVNFADGIGTTVDVQASQDGKTNTIKVNTVMAYTDANGNLLKKANDGKYYLPDQVNEDGSTKDTAVAVDNPQVNLVNPNGENGNSTKTPTRLGNVAGGTNTYADKATTADGQPLVKVGDKYYAPDQFENGKLKADATTTDIANAVTPTSNVTKAKSGLADLDHSDPNNVMTVSDAKNMGWIVSADGNDYAKDVRNANEVKFVGGTGISVTGETKENTREITIAIKEGEVVPSNEFVNPDNDEKLVKVDGKFYKESDIDPTTGKPRDGVAEVPPEIANKAINKGTGFVTGNKVADAIKKSYWTLAKASAEEIAKTNFNNNEGQAEHINPNDNVRFSDGKNTRIALGTVESIDPTGNKITTTTVKFDVDSPIDFKYTSADGKEYVKANNGKFYEKEHVNADGSLKTVDPATTEAQPLTEEQVAQLHKGAQLINGLGTDGKANDAYSTQDPITKAINELKKNNPTASNEEISAAKEKAITDNPTTKDTITKGTGGVTLDNVGWAEKPDQAVNKDQLDQTVNKSGFFVKQNGSSTLTDDANKGATEDSKTEKVTPNDVVDFVNGTNTSVTATTTRENGRDVTKVRVDVTGMPVTYTDKEGNKVAKLGDHYYKVDPDTGLPKVMADGTPDPDSRVENDKVIASMVNPNGETTKPTTLSNIANGADTFEAPKDGDKPLKLANDGKWYEADKVEANGKAKADAQPVTKPKEVGTGGLVNFETSNPHNAANIGDLQNLGWVVSASQTEGGYTDQVRNTNKVDFVGEGLAKITGSTKEDGTREIKVSVQTGEVIGTNSEEPVLKNDDGSETPVIKVGNQYFKKEDLNPDTGLPKDTATALTPDQIAKVVNKQNKGAGLVTGNQVGDAIQHSGWNVGKATADEVNKTTFNNNNGKAEKVNPNDNVRFSDGKNTIASLGTVKVVDEHGVITTTTTVKIDVDSPIDFKYTDASGKEYVKANDGKFYEKEAVNPDGSLKPVQNGATPPTALEQDAIAKLNKGAQLTNGSQADGINNDAYKVADPIQSAVQKAIAETLKENPAATSEALAQAIDMARAEAIKANPEAKDKITQGTGGVTLNNVGWATQPDQAVNKDQLDQTVNKAGFFVKQNGNSTIEGKNTEKVTPNDVVNFVNGGNTVAKAETKPDATTGQDVTDVSIHVTGLPLTYTTKDGTPVTKVGDKFFKVNKDGYPTGEAVPANALATNLVNPTANANEIGAPTVLGNVAAGTHTIASKVDANGNPLIQVGGGDTAKYYAPDQFENGVLKVDAKEAVAPVDATKPMDKAKGGLADLANSNPNNALSVSDASKLGFVVGAKDNAYAEKVRNADAVEFVSGNDIAKVTGETRADGVREIKVTVSKNPVFESLQVGGPQGPRLGASQDGNIRIAKADGSPSRLTNVAPGVDPNDAVNVGQLNAKIGDVHKRINKLDKGMRAGVAGATAVAFLQRPNEAGKSLVSLGVGNFKGQSAVAVGYSRNSDNNKISIKLGSGFNTNGDVNIGGSIGYQW